MVGIPGKVPFAVSLLFNVLLGEEARRHFLPLPYSGKCEEKDQRDRKPSHVGLCRALQALWLYFK